MNVLPEAEYSSFVIIFFILGQMLAELSGTLQRGCSGETHWPLARYTCFCLYFVGQMSIGDSRAQVCNLKYIQNRELRRDQESAFLGE